MKPSPTLPAWVSAPGASAPPVAELIHVNKIYGSGDTTVHALNDLCLAVNNGDYLAVMGASGSGKSTAMNILGCLDMPTSGSYLLNGVPVETLSDDELADLRNQKLGFVFQQFHLLPQLTAMENVMLPMIYAGVPAEQRRQRAKLALEKVGLAHRLDNRPNQLSGGQQQRVAVARSIINGPSLLLADEPTGALDSTTTEEVLAIFDDLNAQGMTILLVTHEQEVGERAQRIIHFRDGRISH
ncbi:MAG: ABC transporter ATP-binding protein [Cyanobium sp. 49614_E6]|jgi:putative ABC transport system ATP-binding protein|nr:ABC transporter ATP-binding protein [Cyanobium sp. 49614_E6]